MSKIERYKELYPSTDGIDELTVDSDGKAKVPNWLMMFLLHQSGLKSRKKRILKKVLKREITKLIHNYLNEEANKIQG